jgi:Icc-related predicted phosphoesterase
MSSFVVISDTHCLHDQLNLPLADFLIHAGDFSGRGKLDEIQNFMSWFSSQPHKHKILIAGNHDFLAEDNPALFRSMIPENVIYLEDEGVEIEEIKFWGSPVTPWFYDWAFNRQRGKEIKAYWDKIPADIDILITHGPAFGFGDKTFRGDLAGCKDLLDAVERTKPKYHIFGHIHEGHGISKNNYTTFINGSNVDYKYRLINAPLPFEF